MVLRFEISVAGGQSGRRSPVKGAARLRVEKRVKSCQAAALLPRLAQAITLVVLSATVAAGTARAATVEGLRQLAVTLPILRTGNLANGAAGGANALNGTAALPTLTTARAVHNLTHAQARLRYPVHLRAVCVVCFADWHGFWVHDGVSGVYVETKNHAELTAAIHPGIVLDIEGFSGPGEYQPIVDMATLHIVGERPLPPAPNVSLGRLSKGDYDGQWVAFEGTVRSAVLRDGVVSWIVMSGGWQINVMTAPAPKEKFERLIGARVRISATGGALINKRRQAVALAVYAPSIDSIKVVKPAPSDPFSLPLTPIMRVFDFAHGTNQDDPIRIRGVVTGRWGQSVFLNDGFQSASILSVEPTSLNPGELVDAVGYPSSSGSTHTLDDAIFKRLGTAPLPQPKLTTGKEASSGDFVDELVRMDGRLIEVQDEADQGTLLVEAGNTVFSAILPGAFKKEALAGLSNGSEIELTGVCVISENQSARDFWAPKVFRILLRSPADLVVIKRASWWTTEHTLLLLAVVLVGTLTVVAWVVALKRRVAKQTILLRESEERFRHMALHDALTGLATRLLFQDRLNVALVSAKRHGTRLAVLMVDLDRFKEVNDTYGHPAGDEVLRVTANRLREIVRKEDTVSRLGGGRVRCAASQSGRFPCGGETCRADGGDTGAPCPFRGPAGGDFSQRRGLHRIGR